jgi:multidrug efflux system outer membrane protein
VRRTAAVAALALASCVSRAPAWSPAAAPAPKNLLPAAGTSTAVVFTEDDPQGSVWRSLGDERLVRLVAAVRSSSPDLAAAAARVRAARAAALRAALERGPRLDGTVGLEMNRAGSRAGGDFDALDASADTSWELDLFGRLRHAASAAELEAMAVEEDRQALGLALEAEAALAWFDWGAAVAEEAVAKETESLLGRTRDLVKARLDAGIGDEVAVHRVETELAISRADVPGARLRAEQALHRIALLLGRPPDAPAEGPPPPAALPAPPSLPVGLPATLLARRPDVRAAERRMGAEHARVREAWAAFLPTVTIDSSLGTRGIRLSDLFSGLGVFGLLGARLRVPLLDGGRLQAERLEAEARRDEAAAKWVSACLVAFADVADAVSGVAARREGLDRRREATAAARRAVEAADTRFESRLVGYLDVVDSHRSLDAARRAEVREDHDLRAALVRLAKALGGAWR